jgi:thiol-disulfide isomerase/thioredoxin
MKKSMILIVMAVLCLFLKVDVGAQSVVKSKQEEVKPLLIGDKVPDMVFDKIFNVSGGKVKFSDYKGKALILDFWGTWCGACISAFPHVQEIQHKYGKYLQVLLIADSRSETYDTVARFLAKRKDTGEEIDLPVIVTKETQKIFDHHHYPHYVWVGADRRIKAITMSKDLEDESIKRLIAGLDVHLPVKLP